MNPVSKYFLYARKSTDETKRQLLSLDAQHRELRELAKRERLTFVQGFEESRTAKEPGRPVFNAMLDRIEQGEADGILVWDIDRLYRNPADEGRVRWMLQRGIITSIRTASRDYTPADAGLLIAVEGGRATDFIIHHKRDVARGVREKLLSGGWPGPRPLGYIYDHDKHNIVPDPKRSKIVQTVFEQFSEGRHGLLWVSDLLAELGVVNKTGNHWSKSQVHDFLTNRLYMGIMMWKGEAFEGKFRPLVSPELFAKVGKALKIRSKPRRVRKGHNFPFCGLFRCTCGSMITAQWAKGNGGLYRYSRCTRKNGPCDEKYVREQDVLAQCLEFLKPLSISPEEATCVRELIDEESTRDGREVEGAVATTVERLSEVQGKLNRLTRAYLDEVIDEESYQAAKIDLILEKVDLKKKKERLHKTGSGFWIEPAKEVITALESAGKQQTEKSPKTISALVQKIGTNRLIARKKVTAGFGPPYDFTSQFLAALRLPGAVNELPHGTDFLRSPDWCPRPDLNRDARFRKPLLYPVELRGLAFPEVKKTFMNEAICEKSPVNSPAIRKNRVKTKAKAPPKR